MKNFWMILVVAPWFQPQLFCMDSTVLKESDVGRNALRSSFESLDSIKPAKTDSSDVLFSVFVLATKPIIIKVKSQIIGAEQLHLAYPVFLKENETGKISLKLMIVQDERSSFIYKTEYSEALSALIRYIKKEVGSDSWQGVLGLVKTLLRRSNDPLWHSLLVDSLYSMYHSQGFTKLILALELNEAGSLDNWIRDYLQVFKENTNIDICAANTTALISGISRDNGEVDKIDPIVVQLVEIGKADVNGANDDGSTPLMFAAQYNRVWAINFLIQKGALIDAFDRQGGTALHIATSEECIDAVACLLRHKANTEIASSNAGFTPLVTAIYRGNADIVKLLLAAGAKPNVMANPNNTALMYAITILESAVASCLSTEQETANLRKIICLLLEDPRTDSKVAVGNGMTALKLANLYKLPDIIDLISAREN